MKIGIYCTVSSKELSLALATLKYSEYSDYVSDIVILITDGISGDARKLTDKITIYSENFGSGYSKSIEDGGYDQISARNYIIDKLGVSRADWLLMHDADDIYNTDFYRYISLECNTSDAVTCSCFSVRPDITLCAPDKKNKATYSCGLLDPHTRAWKKSLGLRYEKSEGIEKYFVNHSRHCGVVFPEGINISCTNGMYHFHLHALLKKRHSSKILTFPVIDREIPEDIRLFLENNKVIFH